MKKRGRKFVGDSIRFWPRVNKEGHIPDSDKYPSLLGRCWEWTGYVDPQGYGNFAVNTKPVRCHSWAWIDRNGPVPYGMCVLHKCDNRACLNPDHLFLGTRGNNNSDRSSKGRNAMGEKHGQSKLNELQVRVMRRMREFGIPYRFIGRVFGVKHGTAMSAVKGKTWTHVEGCHPLPQPR